MAKGRCIPWEHRKNGQEIPGGAVPGTPWPPRRPSPSGAACAVGPSRPRSLLASLHTLLWFRRDPRGASAAPRAFLGSRKPEASRVLERREQPTCHSTCWSGPASQLALGTPGDHGGVSGPAGEGTLPGETSGRRWCLDCLLEIEIVFSIHALMKKKKKWKTEIKRRELEDSCFPPRPAAVGDSPSPAQPAAVRLLV